MQKFEAVTVFALISLISLSFTLSQSAVSQSEELQSMPNLEDESLQTVGGYFNIGHGHEEDGTPYYEFYLFTGFETPPIFLAFNDDVMANSKEWLEYAGQVIAVKSKVNPNQAAVPRFLSDSIVLDVVEIIPPEKIPQGFEVFPESSMKQMSITRTSYSSDSDSSSTIHYPMSYTSEEPPIILTSHLRDNPIAPAVTGPLETLVILSQFRDVTNIVPQHDQNYFDNLFFGTGDSLASFWSDASYGRLTVQGTTLDWEVLPNDRSFYTGNGRLDNGRLTPDAIAGADPTTDFNQVDQIFFIVNTGVPHPVLPNRTSGVAFAYLHPQPINTNEGVQWVLQSFYADNGNSFPVGTFYQKGYGVVAHEGGHNYHWYHTPMFLPHDTYSDPNSLLSGWNDGSAPPGPVAYQKRKANWIDPIDTIQVPIGTSQTITLDYLNDPSPGPNFLIGIVPFGTQGEFYTIEARQDSQFDHIPEPTELLIYQYNPNGYGSNVGRTVDQSAPVTIVMVDPPTCTVTSPAGTCLRFDLTNMDLDLGNTYTDSVNNIEIRLDSQDATSMTVSICNDDCPITPISVSTFDISADTSLLKMRQNQDDSSVITVSSTNGFIGTINLSAVVSSSSDISPSLNPTSVTLSSATSSATSTLTVSSVGSAGMFNVEVTGTDGMLSDSVDIPVKVDDCLIATASFGSAMAPQVQMLRETRDNILLQTQSGSAFMSGFNAVYYSFSPTVAQWENDNQTFKEIVRLIISPLITTLSILNYVDIDSEAEVLTYGIGVIMLNIGMYFILPVFAAIKIKQYVKSKWN